MSTLVNKMVKTHGGERKSPGRVAKQTKGGKIRLQSPSKNLSEKNASAMTVSKEHSWKRDRESSNAPAAVISAEIQPAKRSKKTATAKIKSQDGPKKHGSRPDRSRSTSEQHRGVTFVDGDQEIQMVVEEGDASFVENSLKILRVKANVKKMIQVSQAQESSDETDSNSSRSESPSGLESRNIL